MKFTLNWLKTHLDTDASVEEILYNLTDLGLEVEEVYNPIETLNDFTIGYVSKSQKHPDADKLKICEVATDEGNLNIICGAPNAREGIYVVVAKPGVYVPGIDTTIGVGKIRGVESYGMMCSEREMGLSAEHDGIIELSGQPKIGSKFVEYLSEYNPDAVDPIIEIAITPNRPDALGVRGIARDLAARGIGSLKTAKTPIVNGTHKNNIEIAIDADVLEKGCPVFYSCLIKGVKNDGSIFIGKFSPEAMGDYLAGPNHVLPTSGSARFSSGLSVSDFLKRHSLIKITKTGIERLGSSVINLAKHENLDGHAYSVEMRLKKGKLIG